MANPLLHNLVIIPRGAVTEIDPDTQAPVRVIYQRTAPWAANLMQLNGLPIQRRIDGGRFNPRTPAQSMNRGAYRLGLYAWQDATDQARKDWAPRAKRWNLPGYQGWLRHYLRPPRLLLTRWDLDHSAWDAGDTMWDTFHVEHWDAGATAWDRGATPWISED